MLLHLLVSCLVLSRSRDKRHNLPIPPHPFVLLRALTRVPFSVFLCSPYRYNCDCYFLIVKSCASFVLHRSYYTKDTMSIIIIVKQKISLNMRYAIRDNKFAIIGKIAISSPPSPQRYIPPKLLLEITRSRTFSRTFVVRNIRGMFLNNADSGNSC